MTVTRSIWLARPLGSRIEKALLTRARPVAVEAIETDECHGSAFSQHLIDRGAKVVPDPAQERTRL